VRALVTGATGFIGHHVVHALCEAGHTVTALVRSPAAATDLPVRQIRGHLHDAAALETALADQDVVFHVAGQMAARSEAAYFHGNRDGTANLVRAASQHARHTRFVYVSSMAAGGPSRPGHPLRGEIPRRPVARYGRSKLAAEDAVRASELPWTIVRPPLVYGPRDRQVLRMFRLARFGIAPLFGDGTQELSLVYGPDLADALIAVATSDLTLRRVYYACHPEIVTAAGFARAIGRSLDKRVSILRMRRIVGTAVLALTAGGAILARRATPLTPEKANELFQPAWTADPDAIERDAGWKAGHDLAAGLDATARWYRAAGWL